MIRTACTSALISVRAPSHDILPLTTFNKHGPQNADSHENQPSVKCIQSLSAFLWCQMECPLRSLANLRDWTLWHSGSERVAPIWSITPLNGALLSSSFLSPDTCFVLNETLFYIPKKWPPFLFCFVPQYVWQEIIVTRYIPIQPLLRAENLHKDFQQPPSSIPSITTNISFLSLKKKKAV